MTDDPRRAEARKKAVEEIGASLVERIESGQFEADRRLEDAFAGIITDGEPPPAMNGEAKRKAVIEPAINIESRELTWLWKPWLAAGQFHLLAGRKGVGKTTLALTLAEAAEGNHYGLIVLDPIIRVAGQIRDSHNASQLRTALDPVEGLAQSTGAAILGITHFRKQQSAQAGPVLDSVLGSQAWTAVARLVWVSFKAQDAGRDSHASDYAYCLGLAASNLGPDRAMIPYDIVADHKDITAVEFGKQQDVSATAILEQRAPSAVEQAENWIRNNIAPGTTIPTAELKERLSISGVSWRSFGRANEKGLLKSLKRDGQWCWLRPD